ncbi:MAG TPA: long-chain-acyl-CoA synthetase [Nevskiaceae bacterium]|nr:long-chain-acyl-CoA synthetase [Nevskiaceae bacterium]
MTGSAAGQVRFSSLLRGVAAALPDAPQLERGFFDLVAVRGWRRMSIGSLLEAQARHHPRRVALRFGKQSWTYARFNRWANLCADACARSGVISNDVVAVLMQNRPEALACVAGTVKLGGIAAMLNPQQRGAVLLHSINLVQPRLLVLGEECLEAWNSIKANVDRRGLALYWDGLSAAPDGFINTREMLVDADPENPPSTREVFAHQPCFFIFTSGTTGLPKASVMTHYRWLRGAAGFGRLALRLKPRDVIYCPLPLYHNDALTVGWGSALATGCCFALAPKFSASRFWNEIRQCDATAFCYIGELCRYLLNQPANRRDRDHHVRVVVGNGLRPELWAAFQERFGIQRVCEFYGASECNLAFVNAFGLQRTAGFTPMKYAVVEWSAGRSAPVRGPDGRLQRVPRGESGLLMTQVTSRAPFDGYTDERAGAAKLVRDAFRLGDCWFNTGDLVREQGWRHVQFVDRLGDTFRWKGENVATTEVEAALAACPGVTHAVAYGVAMPEGDGRAGMAAIAMSAQAPAFDGQAVARELGRRLPVYAVPVFLRVQDAPATTGTFKYLKAELQQQGFDPVGVTDRLYVLVDRARGYEPLTPELHTDIVAGRLRL